MCLEFHLIGRCVDLLTNRINERINRFTYGPMICQFCKTQPKTGDEEEARIKAEMERKKRANAQITLVDPKTSQNVGIALAKIRLSNEKVRWYSTIVDPPETEVGASAHDYIGFYDSHGQSFGGFATWR